MPEFDLVVIGAGPGGYVAAIRAAQLGLKTALVERRPALGGTCLNIGCIPSKALLESSELFHTARDRMKEHGIETGEVRIDVAAMMKRKTRLVKELTDGIRFLMKKNGISVVEGTGRLVAPDRVAVENAAGETVELQAAHVLLATGSVPVELPFLKCDGRHIIDSEGALSLDAVPRALVVVGAGAIGLEMAGVWRRMGAKVDIVEMLPRLAPFCDEEVGGHLERALKRQGLTFHYNARVTGATVRDAAAGDDAWPVEVAFLDAEGKNRTLECDKVLVAVGRRPYAEGLGLDALGVRTDAKGFVAVDDHFRTSVPNVLAIGDLIGGAMLAHKAEDEGMAAAEIVAGKPGHVNYDAIPNVIYTHPELAQVGWTEAQAKEKGFEVKTGSFTFRANGRAKTMGEVEGLVKLVADRESDRLLGAHIVGPRASELIAELVLALEFDATAEDVALTCHPHPTLSEAVREAALAVGGRVIHS